MMNEMTENSVEPIKRPTSATVFGILNILFGGLGLLSAPFSWLLYADSADDNLILSAMVTNDVYSSWTQATVILGAIASAVLIASGVGLLNMKPWARVAAIGYSWYTIVIMLIGVIMLWFFVYSPLLDELKTIQDTVQKTLLMGGLLGGLVGGLIGLIYPVMLLVFMTRPRLVAALEGTSAPESKPSMPISSPIEAAKSPVLEASNSSTPPAASLRTRPEATSTANEELLATVIPFRNKPALISYYLGLFSLVALVPIFGLVGVGMAIAALVLGIKGRRRAKQQSEAKGIVHAWVGIVGGALWVVLGGALQVLFFVALVFPFFRV